MKRLVLAALAASMVTSVRPSYDPMVGTVIVSAGTLIGAGISFGNTLGISMKKWNPEEMRGGISTRTAGAVTAVGVAIWNLANKFMYKPVNPTYAHDCVVALGAALTFGGMVQLVANALN